MSNPVFCVGIWWLVEYFFLALNLTEFERDIESKRVDEQTKGFEKRNAVSAFMLLHRPLCRPLWARRNVCNRASVKVPDFVAGSYVPHRKTVTVKGAPCNACQ